MPLTCRPRFQTIHGRSGCRIPAVFFVSVARDIIVLFIHVDDSTITGSSVTLINVFKRRIAKRFSITDLGSISWLLGLAVIRDRAKRMLMISQESYVESLLRCFNLENAKSLTIPINSNTHLVSDNCPTTIEGKQDMKGVPYRELIGALN